jgi:hypothetical protein
MAWHQKSFSRVPATGGILDKDAATQRMPNFLDMDAPAPKIASDNRDLYYR